MNFGTDCRKWCYHQAHKERISDEDYGEDGETPIKAKQTVKIFSQDSPGTQIEHFNSLDVFTKVDTQKSDFTVYCIYKPRGDSIWVTLAMMKWSFTGTAVKNGSNWSLTAGTALINTPWQKSSTLPTWDDNVENHNKVLVRK